MSAAHETAECRRLERWLCAYVDAELDAAHCLEIEDHIESCGGCAERVAGLRATRCSLRRVVKTGAPSALRERVVRTMLDERNRLEDEVEEEPPSQREPVIGGAVRPAREAQAQPKLIKLRYVMPLAAAATLLLVLGATQLQQEEASSRTSPVNSMTAQYASSLDSLIDELVRQHAHPPPPETTDPSKLPSFDPYIGVKVRKPSFHEVDARYVGARMHPKAAMFQYVLRNRHRVTVYQFDTRRVPVKAKRLSRRHYGAARVYVGRVNGYSVAASERDGIGYALAADLSDDEAAKLALMAARE